MGENKIQNICWDCQNAVGRCSWSRDFTPVEGWDAVNVPYQPWETQYVKHRDTYIIKGCPQFVKDEPREVSHLMLSQEENREFLGGKRVKIYAGYHKQD